MLVLGWREWCSLKELNIDRIKAKIDTGAKTSSLHALNIRIEKADNIPYALFEVHPHQKSEEGAIQCRAPIVGEREVTTSCGNKERRLVISTLLTVGKFEKKVEFTLADRKTMGFRILIGRDAIKGFASVNPSLSFAQEKSSP